MLTKQTPGLSFVGVQETLIKQLSIEVTGVSCPPDDVN